MTQLTLHPDRFFAADSTQRAVARELYSTVAGLPLVCPHGHVDPRLFVDPDYTFGSPTELLLIPDHYVFRMLYSQGIALESLAIPRRDGGPTETDHRKAWQIFADHYYLFRGTPTGVWFNDELVNVFGVTEKLSGDNAQAIYDQIDAKLQSPAFRPRALYEQFNIEVLCTTDAATDTLAHHQAIGESGWSGRILPTFRPDAVVNIDMDGWREQIDLLSQVSGVDVVDYPGFIQALEQRRAFFKSMGAKATDHAALTAYTEVLTDQEADAIFQRALAGNATAHDAQRFTGHMLIEMARMSKEDGLVMQIHVGSRRNHNADIYARFGRDMGADIPTAVEFTHNLLPLLNRFGNEAGSGHHPLQFGRDHLFPRAGAAGRPLSHSQVGPALVVLRQHRRHRALLRKCGGDGRHLQPDRLQRRHTRLSVDPGAPRPVATGVGQLGRRAGGARHCRSRGCAGHGACAGL